MDKYTISSACTALSDTAISFTVAAENFEEDVLAYGNVLIDNNMQFSTNINFYGAKTYKDKLLNEMVEHCKNRASIIFKQDPKERMKNIIEQET